MSRFVPYKQIITTTMSSAHQLLRKQSFVIEILKIEKKNFSGKGGCCFFPETYVESLKTATFLLKFLITGLKFSSALLEIGLVTDF